jgi:flagellar biosynthesis chaperone FliJ
MILNTQIEEIVEEIKSGKKDLFETIKYYMLLAESVEEQVDKVRSGLETTYDCEISELEDQISDLSSTIEKQDEKIDKLEYQIECKNGEIEQLKEYKFMYESLSK